MRCGVAAAEAKWTNDAMSADVLTDIPDYKVPALGRIEEAAAN